MQNKLIAYALDISSFLIQKTKRKEEIKQIILFGSVAREEAEKTSDIDIFIDITKDNEKIKKELNENLDKFMGSTKVKNYWKLLGIENNINLVIGKLSEWELESSIIANGITLYGKFKPEVKKGQHKTLFVWENVKPNNKRVLFNKQLLGYKQNNKQYEGLLQKYNGERLGKGCILTPLEHSVIFHKLFKKYRISVRIKKLVIY